jgi:hypothetical protein
MTWGTGGASCGKPQVSRGDVTFEEKNWMGVMAHGGSFDVVEVATQHCDELCCVFE